MKQIKKLVVVFICIAVLAISVFTPYSFVTAVSDDKTATETVLDMGIGWNLGNTLEACDTTRTLSSVQEYETYWGNIVTTQKIIDGIKDAGFKSVRIPVAWSNLMASDYTINVNLLKRVKEVVDYCSNAGLYAIVNIHWDGGWFSNFATNHDESMKKYTSVWTQVSNYFKDYPNNLIFESLNEEGCWDTIWNRYSGTSGDAKTKAYNILNNMNQQFVNIVRASKGNNASRCLLIAGYATDIDLTCDSCFKMPQDTVNNKLIISVHYYTPATFTILTEDASWGKSAYTWGTASEINTVKTDFQKMKSRFADKGIPVIVGEYGTVIENKDLASVRLFLTTVCKSARDMGFCPVLWDSSIHYSRAKAEIKDTALAEFFLQYNPATPTINLGDINNDDSIDALDFAALKKHLLGAELLTGDALKAADIDKSGTVDALDFAQLKMVLLKTITV
jgi:endoglucanase